MISQISLIYAADLNGVIGLNQQLPWAIPSDMRRFRQLTIGKPCIMGRKTFLSLAAPLAERPNIILSSLAERNMELRQMLREHTVFYRFSDCLDFARLHECFVIGGAALLEQFLPHANRIYRTRVLTRIGFTDDDEVTEWEADFRGFHLQSSEVKPDLDDELATRFEVWCRG